MGQARRVSERERIKTSRGLTPALPPSPGRFLVQSARDVLNQRRFFRQQAGEIDLADLGRGFIAVPVRAQDRGVDSERGRRERVAIRLNSGIRLQRVAKLAAPQPRQREQGAMGQAGGLALEQIGGKPLDRYEFLVVSYPF